MPLYDFFCNDCQKHFEELFSADTVSAHPPCPGCGSTNTEQRMSAPSPTLTNPFPYKVGGVHPLGKKMAAGGAAAACPSTGNCGSGGFS
ncbi:MAG: zinc ribbon domain-containing protein [Desulfovibrionaceae bacterium]